MRALLATGLLLLLGGCGFYNGYNGIYAANKFAGQARRSTREGRPSEAAGYWGQAAVKAESLLVRQPRGKWRDEALAIRGEALAALGRCREAVTMLHEAYESTNSNDVREQTSVAIGRCELVLGQPDAAATTLEPVTHSKDATRRGEARGVRARALLQVGDYETALAELRATGVEPTASETIAALAGLGRTEEVQAAFDALVARHDTTLVWDSVLAGVGRRNPEVASRMLDRLTAAGVIPARQLPALLGADAARLQGEARERRLVEVATLAPKSDAGDAARFELARRRLRAAESVQALVGEVDTLREIVQAGQSSATAATQLMTQLSRVAGAADSTQPGEAQGDLRLFLAGELARDSLQSPAVALQLFRRTVTDWPDGAYAPKALLAARQLDGSLAETTDSLLFGRYAENPYVIAARGGDRSAMRQLDDSMAAFERVLTGRPEETRGARGRRPAGATRQPDEPKPGRKTTPNRGRAPEDLQ